MRAGPHLERLDRFLASQAHTGAPGLAVALLTTDALLHVAVHGLADVAAADPVTPDTRFALGSLVKPLIAAVVLQERDAGRLHVDDPVSRYVPGVDVDARAEPITIHHLLTHTAGLALEASAPPAVQAGDRVAPPGAGHSYSNLGYQLLARVVERVTGRPCVAVIRERVLLPLDANATVTAGGAGMAVGYTRADDTADLVPTPPDAYPAGSLVCTAADVAGFARMLLNGGEGPRGRLLSEASVEAMTATLAPVQPGSHYGYGLYVHDIGGHRHAGHTGALLGHQAKLLLDLDDGIGVVVLMNGPGELFPIAVRSLVALRSVPRREPSCGVVP